MIIKIMVYNNFHVKCASHRGCQLFVMTAVLEPREGTWINIMEDGRSDEVTGVILVII